jgi:replicative DNA helicase
LSETVELLVAALVDAGDHEFLIYHPEAVAYASDNAVDQSLVHMVAEHLKVYGKIPARATIEATWGQKLPVAKEPAQFYLDQLGPLHIRKSLQSAAVEAQQHLKTDPEKALGIIYDAASQLRFGYSGFSLIDFRDAKERILKNMSDATFGVGLLPLGWKTFDEMSGGLLKGDFITIAAGTGMGKTFLMLSRAFHFWEVNKVPVLFVSMEMMLDAILTRAAAMQSHIPHSIIKKGILPTVEYDMVKKLNATSRSRSTTSTGFAINCSRVWSSSTAPTCSAASSTKTGGSWSRKTPRS